MSDTIKEYDVTLSKIGYIHVKAKSEAEAMHLASLKKDKEINWISTEPTDVELTEESADQSEAEKNVCGPIQSYVMNTMAIDYNVPTWRIGDTAWFMCAGAEEAEEGTIMAILDSNRGTFMTLAVSDSQTLMELPKGALFLEKEDAENHAKGIIPAYDVKLTATGHTRIIARDKSSAAKLAVNFPSNITWEKLVIQSITKEYGTD